MAELVGTLLFVFITSSIVVVDRVYVDIGTLGVALGFGFAYSALVFTTSRVSGGFLNPTLTLSLWLARKLSGVKTVFYLIFQMLGSILGAMVVFFVFGNSGLDVSLGGPELGLGVSPEVALVLESILVFGLVWVLFATFVDKRGSANLSFAVLGLYIAAVSLIALPITGAVLNPVRAIGPLLLSRAYSNILLFIIAPMFSSLFGPVYEFVFLRQKK